MNKQKVTKITDVVVKIKLEDLLQVLEVPEGVKNFRIGTTEADNSSNDMWVSASSKGSNVFIKYRFVEEEPKKEVKSKKQLLVENGGDLEKTPQRVVNVKKPHMI